MDWWDGLTDANGHELRPGAVNLSWIECACPGATYGGHHQARCRVNGCKAPALMPPEHQGEISPQR